MTFWKTLICWISAWRLVRSPSATSASLSCTMSRANAVRPSPSTATRAASAWSSLTSRDALPVSASRSMPRKARTRSIVARPVSGLAPRASTISGVRSMRSWLFETMSTRRRLGRLARKAMVASSAAGLRAIFSQRSSSSRNVWARCERIAGCASPWSTASITVSGRPSRLARARSFTAASGSCSRAKSTVASSSGGRGRAPRAAIRRASRGASRRA